MKRVELRMTAEQWDEVSAHLFPGDDDEHGAVILAGVAEIAGGLRLIAREVLPARDGIDYVAGERGYRMLTAAFVADAIDRAEDLGLAYIAVHCHGGTTTVGLSPDDRRSHARGYPALLDILGGAPVVGAVFATAAAAADVWLPDRSVLHLDRVVVSGACRMLLTPQPLSRPGSTDARYARQVLLFGDDGQELLRNATVAVVGLGGIGSIVVELLARLGVGHLVIVDDDVVDVTNLPRLLGATRLDAAEWLTRPSRPAVFQRLGRRLARRKVRVARRAIKRANPSCRVTAITGDVASDDVANRLTGADYIFLAADTYRARLVCNAVAFQYGIPGIQLGAKVRARRDDGALIDVYSVIRPFGPARSCLWCNSLIPPARLAEEAVSTEQRRRQRYVEDDTIDAPSVITLNAVAAAHGVDDFLFHIVGLSDVEPEYVRFLPLTNEVERTVPRRDPACPECGADPASRCAMGDARSLPTTGRTM